MSFFNDANEVYEFIGGVIRTALTHPQVGPRLSHADLVVQLNLSDPDARLTIRMKDPMTVEDEADDPSADVRLHMPADIADRFFRGDYNLAIGLARGRIRADGAVERWLAIVPEVRPLFPRYRAMIATKDRRRQ